MKIAIALLLAFSAQAQPNVNSLIAWQRPTNAPAELISNIRYLAPGSVMGDYRTWPVLAVITNNLTHSISSVSITQFFAVSFSNAQTGVESTTGIGPVAIVNTWAATQLMKAMEAAPTQPDFMPFDTAPPKQSLKLWWQGPPGWQTNGGIFNVRIGTTGSVALDYATWPIIAQVTNKLNTIFYNVNPTQFYAVSFSNVVTGTESGEGISPITAQYNWQGVAAADAPPPN